MKQDSRFILIGTCENGEEAIELSKELCPDIVIMDIRLRGMSGIEATQMIRGNCPAVKIIGLSFHLIPDYAEKMIQSGAMGYLSKISAPDEIYKAILEVYQGRTYICKEVSDLLS